MKVKIDTKEKFTVITPETEELNDNFAVELAESLKVQLHNPVKNVVVSLRYVKTISEGAAEQLAAVQQHFYNQSSSFVICEINQSVEEKLEQFELLEVMNITPTESEAWDIVQMEEIERELLDGDDMEFEKD
jgi:anti-anti-sigma regulatory factor